MPTKKRVEFARDLPQGIINPFSDSFLDFWMHWKTYKYQEFRFQYKGCLSEQAALMKLNDLSKGDETEAVEILKESMSQGWQGMFIRKNKTNNNGANKTGATRESVNQEFASRNYAKR